MGGHAKGREASEFTVRGLLSDYYATPDTWPVTQSLDRVLKAMNSWVQQQGATRPELAGMATTLTALVLPENHFALEWFQSLGATFELKPDAYRLELPVNREVLRLVGVLVRRAELHAQRVMPIYTHYQSALPITYGHYLSGVALALWRLLGPTAPDMPVATSAT